MLIPVNDLDGLYQAVNSTANAGATIELQPGIYSLEDNGIRPNGGRLDLQRDMSLIGVTGNPYAVIIDVTNLTLSSYLLTPDLRTGAIRTGNGYNAIEWMILRNNPTLGPDIRSLIQTDMVETPRTYLKIRHTIIDGSSIGVSIVNRTQESNNRRIEAEISNSVFRNNAIGQFGSGIQIQNSQGATEAFIGVRMERNYFVTNRNGVWAFNGSSNYNEIYLSSKADRFINNGVGLALIAGHNAAGGEGNKNFLFFEAEDTIIENNFGTPAPQFMGGGVFAAAGVLINDPDVTPGMVNNNTLEAFFRNCVIRQNVGTDQLNIFGAYSQPPRTEVAGSYNVAHIKFLEPSPLVQFKIVQGSPNDAGGTNGVEVS